MAYVSETPRVVSGPNFGWIANLADAFRLYRARRAAYLYTLNELSAMTERDLADLGISRLMINDIARQAAADVTV